MDQINIQGYDLIAPGWYSCFSPNTLLSWHQGPCYSGGYNCPGNSTPMLNLNDLSQDFVALGIPKAKIGVSARPNASIWRGGSGMTNGGVTGPYQTWTGTAPTEWNDQPNYYWYAIVGQTTNFVAAMTRNHDTNAGATWLSHNDASDANDFFISYDDGWACGQKIKLVQDSSYGGVYCWTIDGMELVGAIYPQADSLKWWSENYEWTEPAATTKRLLIRR
jgi:GH18 family chitinase